VHQKKQGRSWSTINCDYSALRKYFKEVLFIQWPKRKKILAPYRKISKTYREAFLKMLDKELYQGDINPDNQIVETLEVRGNKSWNVKNGYPTMDTKILEQYLPRYINRIPISKSRLEYLVGQDHVKDGVNIIFKDYRNKKDNQATPLDIKTIEPIVAIHEFMRHVLPPYFQKSRYYGLHSSSTFKKYKDNIPKKFQHNTESIKNLFALVNAFFKLEPYACEKCKHTEFKIEPIRANPTWIFYNSTKL
jgi:hypothetical protein